MNGMEIISLVMSIAVLLKLVIFLVKPKLLSDMASNMVKHINMMKWPMVALLVVIGYYVFTNLTITQAFPAFVFGYLVFGVFMFSYPKLYKIFVAEVFKDTSKTWLVWVIWVGLSVLVLYSLFA